MRLLTPALIAALILLPVRAFAGQCQVDIGKIDQALSKAKLDNDQKQEVTDLREQAVQLCGAGTTSDDSQAMLGVLRAALRACPLLSLQSVSFGRAAR